MSNPFFEHPILNSPYASPARHWELDEAGQPTQKIIELRRGAKFITPIPKPKKRKAAAQTGFVFDEGKATPWICPSRLAQTRLVASRPCDTQLAV